MHATGYTPQTTHHRTTIRCTAHRALRTARCVSALRSPHSAQYALRTDCVSVAQCSLRAQIPNASHAMRQTSRHPAKTWGSNRTDTPLSVHAKTSDLGALTLTFFLLYRGRTSPNKGEPRKVLVAKHALRRGLTWTDALSVASHLRHHVLRKHRHRVIGAGGLRPVSRVAQATGAPRVIARAVGSGRPQMHYTAGQF